MSLRKHQFVKIERPDFVVDNLLKSTDNFEECAKQLDRLMELNVDAQLSVDNSWETAKQLNHISTRFDEKITYGHRELAERKKVKVIKESVRKIVKKPSKKVIRKTVQSKPKPKKQEKIDYIALHKLKENLDALRTNM